MTWDFAAARAAGTPVVFMAETPGDFARPGRPQPAVRYPVRLKLSAGEIDPRIAPA